MLPENAVNASFVVSRLLARNEVARAFFAGESSRLADVSQQMAAHFQEGGRLVAFGRGPYATDAQHVSVEFVHPVIVGKKALPALDVSATFEHGLSALLSPHDMVMGFGPPEGDPVVAAILEEIARKEIYTMSLNGASTGAAHGYAVNPSTTDPFVYQEIIEILYHTLWETVHVFLEHNDMGHDVGAANFLYPFLTDQKQDTYVIKQEVAASIVAKVAEDEKLRKRVADEQSDVLARAAELIDAQVKKGGKIMVLGNGGSATDANDFAMDCMTPPPGKQVIPAISLSMEPAILSALANDVGPDVLFLRQLIAHKHPADVVLAFSTSGNSRNVIAALVEARKAGLVTVVMAGCDGGEIARQQLADVLLIVPSNYIPRIQEIQASMYHTLIETLHELRDGKN